MSRLSKGAARHLFGVVLAVTSRVEMGMLNMCSRSSKSLDLRRTIKIYPEL
jgi:hypothetical protein